MAQVWVGYSSNLGFRDLIVAYIDPFFAPVEDEDDPVARLVQDFGADPIGPGDFEAHERTDKALTPGAFLDSVPFSVPASELNGLDWPNARTVFFVINAAQPRKWRDQNVEIVLVRDVTFDWD